jgi:hypothetical protein
VTQSAAMPPGGPPSPAPATSAADALDAPVASTAEPEQIEETTETPAAQGPQEPQEPQETHGAELAVAEQPEEPEEPEDGLARFQRLVEERVRRLRYSHGLRRAIYTPEEEILRRIVDRRAAVWVPAFTFAATAGSAVAAIVLATRIGSDPGEQTGAAFWVVLGAVALLAGCFLTVVRSEVYFQRLRPGGRVVRTDVADAYEAVRDAPRAFVELGAEPQILTRIADLLPVADQLVDALTDYAASGGTLVRAHPAYDRIIRMRAEVEVLAQLLAEAGHREPGERPWTQRDASAPVPRPEQIADYESLGDIASFVEQPGEGGAA